MMYLGGTMAIIGFAPFVTHAVLRNTRDQRVEDYINHNLPAIVSAVEKATGFRFPELPVVRYGENKEWAAQPAFVKFLVMPLGSYSPDEDTIYLYSGVHYPPKKDLGDFIAETLTFDSSIGNPDQTIAHELGHFYTDKLTEHLGNTFWNWKAEGGVITHDFMARKLIGEGIAVYFERKWSGEKDEFNDSEWPNSIVEFDKFKEDNRIFYLGGYHLVKPIIDKFGVKGITYLVENYPAQDLLNLPLYQQRVLRALSINSSPSPPPPSPEPDTSPAPPPYFSPPSP